MLPRFGSNYDSTNIVTGDFNGRVRELAWSDERKLADPFEIFLRQTPNLGQLYSDKLHPNAAGYDLLARIFADVLTNVDTVPPVTGLITPINDSPRVPPTTPVASERLRLRAGDRRGSNPAGDQRAGRGHAV